MKLRFIVYMIGLLFLSCTREHMEPHRPPIDKERITVTLGMQTPDMTETKALSDNEYTIREVLIMVFIEGKYAYYTEAHDLVRSGNRYTFGTNLEVTNDEVTLVAVANISSTVKAELDRVTASMSIADAKKQSYVLYRNFIDRRELFPMTGEVVIADGLIDQSVQIPDFHMIRAFSRVDVVAHPNIESRFRMQKLQAYHVNHYFQLAPDQVDNHKVTAPSVPAAAQRNAVSAEFTVSGDRITGLYLPEAEQCLASADPTCLIIAGNYKNRPELSYYRVDLKTGDDIGKILRNHKYTVTVTSVSGPGSASISEALNSPSNDINTYIVWEEDGSTTIYDKNGNEITVSDRTFSLHFAQGAMDVITVDLKSDLANSKYTVEWADENGDPIGGSLYGYGQTFEDANFRVKIADDGSYISVSALTENPGTTHRTRKLLIRTVAMNNNILFNLSIDQATRAERTYVNLYNRLGLYGDLGDEIFSVHRDPTYGNMLRDLIKNEIHFGTHGTIPFDGFKIAGQNHELKITNYLIRSFDVVLLPEGNIDADEAQNLINWLENDPRKVLVAYTSNQVLLEQLGVSSTSEWPAQYRVSPQAADPFLKGPFGNVSSNYTFGSGRMSMFMIPAAVHPEINPLVTTPTGNISIGVDLNKRIVYMSDYFLFDDMPGTNYGLLTGNGVINPSNNLDILMANLWAWIAETCLNDRYDPEISRN